MGAGIWKGWEAVYVTHVWKEKTPEGQREIRAVKFGKAFRLQSKLRGQDHWTYHEVPALTDLTELRDILFRKYQRRRAPYEDLLVVDALIKKITDGSV